MISALAPSIAAQAGVFTTGQAVAAGLTGSELRSRLRGGELIRLRRDVFTSAALVQAADAQGRHRLAVAAALAARGWTGPGTTVPTLAAGRRSAAALWGLPANPPPRHAQTKPSAPPSGTALFQLPAHVDLVSSDRCRRTYRAGVSVRPAHLPTAQTQYLQGVPVTSLARTAVDLMRESTRQGAIIVGDAALRLGCSREELLDVARRCAMWRGGRQAREIARLANPLAESPAESVGRLLTHDRGLPPTEPQLVVVDARGQVRRLDIAFRAQRTTLEIDGKIKYTEPWGDPATVLWEEKLREDAIRDIGWEVVRATWHQLVYEPDDVVERLLRAFARAERRAS